jgi:hypothetical protein
MAVGLPLKTTYANGDVYSASDVNDTNGTVNLFQTSTLSVAGGKNRVTNGGMDWWQRGTSFTIANGVATAYQADRWQTTRYATGATVTRQTTSDTTNLPTIQYCMRIARDSGNTSTGVIATCQAFETINSIPFAGQTVTLSFYARRGANYSAASNALSVAVKSGTGTDQNLRSGFTSETSVINSTATLTTTWQRFTYTGTVGATATQLAPDFQFTPTGTAGAADYYEITGVQLELGSYATTFSRVGGSIQGELAMCQRYCYSVNYLNGTKGVYNVLATGRSTSSTAGALNFVMPVSLRVAPTSVAYGGTIAFDDGSTAPNITALTISQAAVNNTLLSSTVASGLTAFRPALLYANNDANAYVRFEAEL